ncbi:hypothetical protein [Leucobacter chromiiresistens]|nr:hypothetical protein [Leucobacter chromiiresistens]
MLHFSGKKNVLENPYVRHYWSYPLSLSHGSGRRETHLRNRYLP